MREIKFDLLMKNRHTGDFHHKKYHISELMMGVERLFDFENYVLEATRQYTGLKDKSGKEIFESDVIDSKYKLTVVYKNGSYWGVWLKNKSERDLYAFLKMRDYAGCPVEIIGNIYENKNLLEDL